MTNADHIPHIPVLLETLVGFLKVPADGVIVDATVGQGGHAEQLARQLGPEGLLIGLDVDSETLSVARQRLESAVCRVELKQENFSALPEVLAANGITGADAILADLGVNSAQLGDPQRGLSFQTDGPLDMRLDDRLGTTAADLVNSLKEEELANLIWQYGEERRSRRIARTLVEARRRKRIQSTGELARLVLKALRITTPGHRSRIHPATRTFQALRIAINEELQHLEQFLEVLPRCLKPQGHAAVISFHSLEDRLVKNSFRAGKTGGWYRILTKKPIMAEEEECRRNPRSRSAKLRVAQRISTETA